MYCAEDHAYRSVQGTEVFAEEISCSESVEGDGAGEAGFAFHEGGEEGAGAMVKGSVVRMVADAGWVEGEKDVYSGCWRFGVVGVVCAAIGGVRFPLCSGCGGG